MPNAPQRQATPARVATATPEFAANDPRAPLAAARAGHALRAAARATAWLALALGVAGLARSGLYDSGDDVGYWLGVAGGSAMLVLLLYPLRKRVPALEALGRLRHWFWMHMALGIGGPVLILLHSNLRLGSLNASVAFWSMVVVAGSGIAGRFLYGRLHRGLYGRQQTLAEARAEAAALLEAAHRELAGAPQARAALDAFAAEARAAESSPWRLALLPLRGRRAIARCRSALRAGDPDAARSTTLLGCCRDEIAAAVRAAQFRAAERLFALWHVAHLPLVVILALTAVVHVVAVHMY